MVTTACPASGRSSRYSVGMPHDVRAVPICRERDVRPVRLDTLWRNIVAQVRACSADDILRHDVADIPWS